MSKPVSIQLFAPRALFLLKDVECDVLSGLANVLGRITFTYCIHIFPIRKLNRMSKFVRIALLVAHSKALLLLQLCAFDKRLLVCMAARMIRSFFVHSNHSLRIA